MLDDCTGGEEAFDRVGQGELLRIALDLASTGLDQDSIIEQLRARYPALQHESYYQNPAAEAVMRRVVLARQRAAARDVDLRRLRAKGLPESLADRPGAPAPDAGRVAVPTARGSYE